MNKRFERARIVIDVEKPIHKQLRLIAVQEDKSLRMLLMEAIDKLLKDRSDFVKTTSDRSEREAQV